MNKIIIEAPDKYGLMTDDELSAQEEQERAEFEKQIQARRDAVAKNRQEKEKEAQEQAKKEQEQQELNKRGEELQKELGDNFTFEELFDVLVPSSGMCETLAGELVRAINKIEYRWFNDGDKFFYGYGKETAGSAANFLLEYATDTFEELLIEAAENEYDDFDYEDLIVDLKSGVVNLIKEDKSLLAKKPEKDMLEMSYDIWDDYVPTHDFSIRIPLSISKHVDNHDIDSSDIEWYIQGIIENMGNSSDDIRVNNYEIDIYDLSSEDYDELDENLEDWLEEWSKELDEEYPEEDEDEEEEE